MTDVAPEPEVLTDEAILARFQRSKNQPTGSQTLGFRIVAVSQAEKSVEVEFEAKGEAFHLRLRKAFLDIACAEPERCRVIDAAGSPEAVESRLWAAVAPLLVDG